MKLKIVEAKHIKNERVIRYRISFDKGGIVRISKGISQLMEFEPGDLLSFVQDQEEKTNWYIGRNLKGGMILKTSSDRTYLYGRSNVIRDRIDSTIGIRGKSYTFSVTQHPIDTVDCGKIYAILNGTRKMSIRDKGGESEGAAANRE